MSDIPVTGAIAEYRGLRIPILFSGEEWVALKAAPNIDVPDALERGETPVPHGLPEAWVKVPRSALDGIVHLRVTAKLAGHVVLLDRRLPSGRIAVEFVGPPEVAHELGLKGDQYMGWTGSFEPEDFSDIEVEEVRRA
jgi:hypothetical protein